MEELKTLKKEIEDLKNWKNNLESASNIPLSVDQAFRKRLGGLAGSTLGSYTSIRRTINLSGNAESISVLEDPAGYILVNYAGTNYKIPYFVD